MPLLFRNRGVLHMLADSCHTYRDCFHLIRNKPRLRELVTPLGVERQSGGNLNSDPGSESPKSACGASGARDQTQALHLEGTGRSELKNSEVVPSVMFSSLSSVFLSHVPFFP